MRYKEDFAEFTPIGHGAHLIAELAGLSIEDVRKDIIDAIQDYELKGRVRNIRDERRRWRYHTDQGYDYVIQSLRRQNTDWDQSVVACGCSDPVPTFHKVEVNRHLLLAIWCPINHEERPDSDRKIGSELDKPREGAPDCIPPPKPEDGEGDLDQPADFPEPTTQRELGKAKTSAKYANFAKGAKELKKQNPDYKKADLKRLLEKEQPKGGGWVTADTIERALNNRHPGWAD